MKNKIKKLSPVQKQELKQDLEKLKGRVLFPEKVELANQLLSRIVLPTNFQIQISIVLGRTPTIEEYIAAVDGINLTKFTPSSMKLVNQEHINL